MDKTPQILKIIEPHVPKATSREQKMPGGCELYLNNREYRLLIRVLKRGLPPKGNQQGEKL